MPRLIALLCALAPLASTFSPTCMAAISSRRPASAVSMAHHVQKKATRGHNAYRPRKSRLSDRNRTPPSYPAIPDIPWMAPIDSLSGKVPQTFSIAVEPSDTADGVRSKVTAAGRGAPEQVIYSGSVVTGSLGEAGLAVAATLEVAIVSP